MGDAKGTRRIEFRIAHSDGEYLPNHSHNELVRPSPHTRGWQSPRFCQYPLEIGLQLEGRTYLETMQFLSHEYKIATRVEIWLGDHDPLSGSAMPSYDQCKFRRIGYVSLDANQKTDFRARELKTVNIRMKALFIKLLFHKCHVNTRNLYNQVGMIAINVMGTVLNPVPFGAPLSESMIGLPPGASTSTASRPEKLKEDWKSNARIPKDVDTDDVRFAVEYDRVTAEYIEELQYLKEVAVHEENYERAKRIKAVLLDLKDEGKKITKLEKDKLVAVEREDYDSAKRIRDQLAQLRDKYETAIQTLRSQTGEIDSVLAPPAPAPVAAPKAETRRPPAPFDAPPAEARGPISAAIRQPEPAAASHPVPEMAASPPAARAASPPIRNFPPAAAGGAPEAFVPFDERPIKGMGNSQLQVEELGPDSDPMALSGANFADRPVRQAAKDDAKEPPKRRSPRQRSPRRAEKPAAPTGGGGGGEMDSGSFGGGGAVRSGPRPEKKWEARFEALVERSGQELTEISASDRKKYGSAASTLGNYLLACLLAKPYQIRQAAIEKIIEKSSDIGGDARSFLMTMGDIAPKLLEDKIPQVYTVLLEMYQALLLDDSVSDADRHAALDKCMKTLMARLGDSNTRFGDATIDFLLFVASRPALGGVQTVVSNALKLGKKQQPWKPVLKRLELFTRLTEELGGENVDVTAIMPFVRAAMESANAQVRQAAVALTGLLGYALGRPAVEKYVSDVKPALKKLIDAELDKAGSATPKKPVAPSALVAKAAAQKPTNAKSGAPAAQKPKAATSKKGGEGGADVHASVDMGDTGGSSQQPINININFHGSAPMTVSTDAGGVSTSYGAPEDDGSPNRKSVSFDSEVETKEFMTEPSAENDLAVPTCQFCGRQDENFTEKMLDIHWYKECPMLCTCQHCGQVIQISELNDHLLTECTQKPTASDAARMRKEIQNIVCPMCKKRLPDDSEEIWEDHLLDECPKNPRMPKSILKKSPAKPPPVPRAGGVTAGGYAARRR